MLNNFKRWWQVQTGKQKTPIDDEIPFWILSLLFHLVLFAILSKKVIVPILDGEVEVAVEQVIDVEELDVAPEVQFAQEITEDLGANSDQGAELALAQADMFSDVPEVEQTSDLELRDLGDLPVQELLFQPTAPQIESVAVKGRWGWLQQERKVQSIGLPRKSS